MRKLTTLALLFSLLILSLSSAPTTPAASAQQQTEFQYAAKFVCGRIDGGIAAPGQYYTIVNVHNPSPNRTVEFRKKFARALPGEKAGKITPFFKATLRADEAMGIDCPDIYSHAGIPSGTFIEGYVVIQIPAPAELDVVSVYTAGAPNVSTLHTERVPARRIPMVFDPPACGSLDVSLNTGVANWRIVADPVAGTPEPRAATVITPPLWPSPWVNPLPGTRWIGPTANADGGVGKHTYETCFCMCSGFSNAALTYRAYADDAAVVSLNGTQIGVINGFSGAPTAGTTNNQSLFKEGTNCVRVVVDNPLFITGLDLAGTVTATAGMCPAGTAGAEADPVRDR